jgi:hypothetical protein
LFAAERYKKQMLFPSFVGGMLKCRGVDLYLKPAKNAAENAICHVNFSALVYQNLLKI